MKPIRVAHPGTALVNYPFVFSKARQRKRSLSSFGSAREGLITRAFKLHFKEKREQLTRSSFTGKRDAYGPSFMPRLMVIPALLIVEFFSLLQR